MIENQGEISGTADYLVMDITGLKTTDQVKVAIDKRLAEERGTKRGLVVDPEDSPPSSKKTSPAPLTSTPNRSGSSGATLVL